MVFSVTCGNYGAGIGSGSSRISSVGNVMTGTDIPVEQAMSVTTRLLPEAAFTPPALTVTITSTYREGHGMVAVPDRWFHPHMTTFLDLVLHTETLSKYF